MENQRNTSPPNYQTQQILDVGHSMRWSQLVWSLVDGLKQPYDTVAHRMTLGEIAQGMVYLELREAMDAANQPKD